jgi:hypothetical protein
MKVCVCFVTPIPRERRMSGLAIYPPSVLFLCMFSLEYRQLFLNVVYSPTHTLPEALLRFAIYSFGSLLLFNTQLACRRVTHVITLTCFLYVLLNVEMGVGYAWQVHDGLLIGRVRCGKSVLAFL